MSPNSCVQRLCLLWKRSLPPKELALVHVQGESMEPTLTDGDLVLLRYQNRLDRDGIFVLNYDGELFIKRGQRLGRRKAVLISDNAAYQPMEIALGKSLCLIGRAVWAGHTL